MNIAYNPLETVDAYSAAVTLVGGRTVDAGNIRFDETTYHFYLDGVDVTNSLTQSQKAANWPRFDRAADNLRAYNEAYAAKHGGQPPPATGSTSTAELFINQMLTEPFKAPADSLERQLSGSPLIKTGMLVGGLALVAYLVSKFK